MHPSWQDLFLNTVFIYYWISGSLTQLTLSLFVRVFLPCTVQHVIMWYTWKSIVELTFELFWSYSVLVTSIHEHFAQQRMTNFQCGNEFLNDGYAHIVAIAMSDAVLNTCLTCGMTECLYVSNRWLAISPDLMFCAWRLWYLSVSKNRSCYDNNDECILLADIYHSQPHIPFYWWVVFISWGGRILCKVESLIMILFSAYIDYFITPSSGGINIILCGSLTETFNNSFVNNFYLFTINGNANKIIWYWRLHKLRMM